ncbi:MAG: hypothetical protein LJE95_01935 [Acidobacteria bacterium]|jgi:hypothetical protein|nr:hypothetical protein [Acidobacteriota bacterium]
MSAGHVTPRRRLRFLALMGVAGGLLIAAALWWWLRPERPIARADRLLAANPALDLPAEPLGLVVVARPGAWARLLAHHPDRRLLLDPTWWRELRGPLGAHRGALAPAAAAVALLDQLPRGLVAAWWADGWVVQGTIRGGNTLTLPSWLPEGLRQRSRLHNGVLRVASSPDWLEGWGWRPAEAGQVAPHSRLSCWARINGQIWSGLWSGNRLTLTTGVPPEHTQIPATGAALISVPDTAWALAEAGVRLPASGFLAGLGREVEALLSRPSLVWVDEVAPAQPLPRPRLVIDLPLTNDEREPARRSRLLARLRSVLCPLGCSIARRETDSGAPVERWRSPLATWWVTGTDDAVVLATGHDQLERWLGRPQTAFPNTAVLIPDGPRAAASLAALGQATLLADLGLVPRSRLRLLAHLAGPLRGIATVAWTSTSTGQRLEVELATGGGADRDLK